MEQGYRRRETCTAFDISLWKLLHSSGLELSGDYSEWVVGTTLLGGYERRRYATLFVRQMSLLLGAACPRHMPKDSQKSILIRSGGGSLEDASNSTSNPSSYLCCHFRGLIDTLAV